MVKNLLAMQETCIRSLGQEDPLEKGMATYSSILAWRIPWTEEPGRLQIMEWQRVRHYWETYTLLLLPKKKKKKKHPKKFHPSTKALWVAMDWDLIGDFTIRVVKSPSPVLLCVGLKAIQSFILSLFPMLRKQLLTQLKEPHQDEDKAKPPLERGLETAQKFADMYCSCVF